MSTTTVDDYKVRVSNALLDLNRRDRLALLAELDRMLAELPAGARPEDAVGSPGAAARLLREAAGQPDRLRWRTRFRRSARRFKVGFAVVTVAAVAAGWFGVAANRYALELGGFGSTPDGYDELRQAGQVEEAVYSYRPGRPVEFGLSLRNPGRLPVRVTDVLDLERSVLVVDEIRIGPSDGTYMYYPANAEPLDQAELAPGQERAVWVRAHLWTCDEQRVPYEGGSVGYDVAVLRYRIGPVHREQWLELPTEISVRFDRPSWSYCTQPGS